MKPYNFLNVIPAGTVLHSNINSQPMQLYNSYNFCVQVVFTGTPTGSFFLQASADPAFSGIPNEPQNWSTLSGTTVAVSAAGNYFQNYSYPGFNWVRICYTDASSGASTAIVTSSTLNVKGI